MKTVISMLLISALLQSCGGGATGPGGSPDPVAQSVGELFGGMALALPHGNLVGFRKRGYDAAIVALSASISERNYYVDGGPFSGADCPGSDAEYDGCTITCPTEYRLQANCVGVDSQYICSGTTYEISDAVASAAIDFTNYDATGNIEFELSIAAKVSGGSLDGGTLTCILDFSLDSEAAENFEANCDVFDCNYAGEILKCADVRAGLDQCL